MALALITSTAHAAPPGFEAYPGEHPGRTEARAFVTVGVIQGKNHAERIHYQCGHLAGEDQRACDLACAWPADDACGFVTTYGAAGAALLEAAPVRAGDSAAAARAAGVPDARSAGASLYLQTRLGWDDPADPMRPPKPLTPTQRRDLVRADAFAASAKDAPTLLKNHRRRARVYDDVFTRRHPRAILADIQTSAATLDAGLPKVAAGSLERSVPKLERALPVDHPAAAHARLELARARFWSGDVTGALAAAEDATRALERVFGRHHWELIPALALRAQMHLDLGEPMRAVTLSERAFAAAVAFGDVWGERSFEPLLVMARAKVALDDTQGAEFALQSIEQVLSGTDLELTRVQQAELEFARAAVAYRQVSPIGDGINQQLPSDYKDLIAQNNASLKKAREHLLSAYGSGHWRYAQVMIAYGEFFLIGEKVDEALKAYDLAEQYAQMARTPNFIWSLRVEELRARALAAKGALNQAEAAARKAADALDAHHPRRLRDRANARRTLALILWRQGRVDRADHEHTQARAHLAAALRLDTGENIGDTQLLRHFSQFMVTVHEGLSLATGEKSLGALDALVALQGSAMRLSRERLAWKRITSRVPRALRPRLQELREGESYGFPSGAREEKLRELLSPFDPALAKAPPAADRDAICVKLARERAHLVNYVATLRHTGYEENPKKIDRFHGARTGFTLEMNLEAVVVGGPTCKERLITLGPLREVRAELEAYRELTTAAEACFESKGKATRCRKDFGKLEAQAAVVRKRVWDPVEAAMGSGSKRKPSRKKPRRVYVVPDDKLVLVPLDGLPRDDGTYVVEDHTLTTLPYALAMVDTPRDLVHLEGPSRGGEGAFVLGDVDYGEDADGNVAMGALRECTRGACQRVEADVMRAAIASNTRGGGGGTPMSRKCVSSNVWGALRTEALAVAELLSDDFGSQVFLSTGDAATEFVTRALMPGKRVIHMATHGFFSASNSCLINAMRPTRNFTDYFLGDEPLMDFSRLGAIVLAGANTGHADPRRDGLLNGADIAALDLTSVELVVLSACQTALGIEVAGEGSLGLTRGFVLAGARDVVGSLWQVPSRQTSDLFRDMYTFMMSKRTRSAPPEALRRAKLEAIKRARSAGLTSSSFLWAAFVPMRTRR
jgi:hypothetical protein